MRTTNSIGSKRIWVISLSAPWRRFRLVVDHLLRKSQPNTLPMTFLAHNDDSDSQKRQAPRELSGRCREIQQVRIGEATVHSVRQSECVDHVMVALDHGLGGWIATANLDHLLRLRRSEDFRRAYEGASMVVADGMPLIWASRLQGTPLPERVAGSDLIYSLTAAAARDGRSVFFLGGNPGSAEAAAAKLCELSPGLQVRGTCCPPMGFDQQPALVEELSAMLAESGADIVFVALGSPKQELLIERIRSVLPNAWWIGVGISFSFVAEEVVRAPRWMQRLGVEWVHRLAQEPGRLWNRYLVQGLPYAGRLMAQSMWRRFTPRAPKS